MDINLPISPPVNNNIQISLNDRLDAIMFEKIRVANTQLDTRLSLQEKIINKYRRDVERVHAHQSQRLRREVKKIRQKKPDYVFDDSDLSSSKSRFTTETGRQRCKSEPCSLSYCRRYYSHHYNVRDTSKEDKQVKDVKRKCETDFFNMKLRLYFLNMMNNAHQKTHLEHDSPREYKQSSTDMELCDSFDHNRPKRFLARNISTDEESDDVFGNSHSSFKSLRDLDPVDTENDAIEHEMTKIYEEDEDATPKVSKSVSEFDLPTKCDESVENVVNVSLDKRGHQRGRKIKRRSIIGSGSEAEHDYNEAERRKSKYAFEKIFAGLL